MKELNWHGWTFIFCRATNAEAAWCDRCGLLNDRWPMLHPYWGPRKTAALHRGGIGAMEPGHRVRFVQCVWPSEHETGCSCYDCLEAQFWAETAYQTQLDELRESQRVD